MRAHIMKDFEGIFPKDDKIAWIYVVIMFHNDPNLLTPIILPNKLTTKAEMCVMCVLVWMIHDAAVPRTLRF